MAEATPSPQQPPFQAPQDDIEYLASGTLARRRDGGCAGGAPPAGGAGGSEVEPLKPSGRQFYYRQNADYDSLIEACSRKLVAQPSNVRALMIRANSYVKKGAPGLWGRVPRDCTACAALQAPVT
jgi:hypothetical protein